MASTAKALRDRCGEVIKNARERYSADNTHTVTMRSSLFVFVVSSS